MTISYPERVARLNKHIGQGTLIRMKYKGKDSKGRATVCLLAALSPEVANSESPAACPADVMPAWLARLTVAIDDTGTVGAWEGTIRRYASLAAHWHALGESAWDRLEINALQIAILQCKEVVPKDLWAAVSQKVQGELSGDVMTEEERKALYRKVEGDNRLCDSLCSRQARTAMLRALQCRPRGHSTVEHTWLAAKHTAYPGNYDPCARGAIDRMTNLLFDAIEKEIDLAKEETT